MKRKIAIVALSAGLACAGGAYAASVHFKHGSLLFNDLGLTLQASGALAGLGNEDIVINMTATADPVATCTNPHGKTQPPGQNPATVAVSANPLAVPKSEVKNGELSFTITTNPPTTPIPGAPDCPNSQWTENITDLKFTSATITVQQPAPTVVLTAQCTFNPPTTNGLVPSTTVRCR